MNKSLRLKGYDYRKEGYYHVVLCTAFRLPLFGFLEERKVLLSKLGEILMDEIRNTMIIRKNVRIDEYIIMPDHVHLIVQIMSGPEEGTCCSTSPLQALSTSPLQAPPKNSLGSIINHLKRAVSKRYHLIQQEDKRSPWQSRYYDEIINSLEQLEITREYIRNNPLKHKDIQLS